MVRGTGILQQYVDKQQLPEEMDGDFHHCHSDWLVFRLVRFLVCLHVVKMILHIYLAAVMNYLNHVWGFFGFFFKCRDIKTKTIKGETSWLEVKFGQRFF